MKILAFDVSNNFLSVAISDGYNILSYIQDNSPSAQAERLVVVIHQALADAGLDYSNIEYLAVTNGPGSFTGIRIGLACAKGILFDSHIRGTAVNNFEIYYYRAIQQIVSSDKIIVLLNAYRGQLYVKIFERQVNSQPMLLSNQESINLIREINSTEKIVCIGSGVALIYSEIRDISNVEILPRFSQIKAWNICRYINDTIDTRALIPIEPLYIRAPDAKVSEIKSRIQLENLKSINC